MNVYTRILEIARRSNPDAIRWLFKSKNGTVYAFTDDGKFVGPYTGSVKCDIMMPPELEEMVKEAEI
ncbi:hypothetical protein [Butyricicoccus sp.]|uniref:hypothetical protein n=1 Tax=Butyricicoccus sp. TaxID=2049021 RepID=UPI003D7DDCB2